MFNRCSQFKLQFCGCAVIFVLCFLFSQLAFSQVVRVITTKDGLPQSLASGLVQDNDDFVWIGTRNGLARYDGLEFKTFQHNVNDALTPASNLIIWLSIDARQNLWIEHESGEFDRLNVKTEQLEHFSVTHSFKKHNISFIRRGWIIDNAQRFWCINQTGGVTCLNGNKTQLYNTANHALPTDTLRGVTQDKSNNIWVLTQTGLALYHKANNSFTHFATPQRQDYNTYFDSEKEVVDLHQRKNGELMWGDRRRLFFFNTRTKNFRTVLLPLNNVHGVRWIRTGTDGKDYFEVSGEVYEYTDKGGLKVIMERDADHPLEACSFLIDRSGMIWIGTNAGGVQQLSLTTPYFRSFNYKTGFHYDLLGQTLKLQPRQLFDWYASDGPVAASSYHFRSAYDAQHDLWMALKQTVCRYNVATKQVTKLPFVKLDKAEKDEGVGIQGITITPAGEPMIVSYNGEVLVFNKASCQWQPFIPSDAIRRKYGTSLIPRDILDDGTRVWITTDGDGLLFIDKGTKQLHQLKYELKPGAFPASKLLGFKADPSRPDILWIGSYEGLICFNKKTLRSTLFSLAQGLPDNTIYSIQADKAGYLWLSTNKGLCRFNPKTHRLRIFQTNYGLPGDEFNRFHHLALPDGRLAFGGTDGWTLFNPLAIKNDDFEPRIAFTSLKINNEIASRGKNGILPAPLQALNSLRLSHDQNTLAFQFAGLQYNQPKDIFYRYRLIGYDDNWIQAGHNPVANYTKIPPGKYLLKINASNTTGEWSRHVKYLHITITPPWWLTWPAYVFYGAFIAALIWAYTRYRIHRELMSREVELIEKETRQLREMDEVKTRFFSNITHEFRTPLTLILGPAERLKTGQLKHNEQDKLADTIERNARHLLRLINQLMDMAKLEAGAVKPREGIGSPAVTISAIIESFREEVNNKRVTLQFDDNTTGGNYHFAPDMLGHVVYNLLGNAIKFTPGGGSIKIVLDESPTGIKLTITDTGIGIPADRLPHIFNRFYQAEQSLLAPVLNNGRQEGTGIGLSLVKEMVELQGGTIEAKSTAGESALPGTTFIVELPFKKVEATEAAQHPNMEEVTAEPGYADEMGPLPLVLLVEDNADLASFITDSLADHYRVQHAWNGLQGTVIAVETMPDLIISDVLMHVMDGYTMCKQLKEDVRTSHIPVILLTAKSTFENRMEGLQQGADDYLTKPFEVAELLLRLQNILKRQQKLKDYIHSDLSVPGLLMNVANEVHDAFITRLYDYVEEHLDDTAFGVDQMVDFTNMSRTSLHRKVKAISGMSTTELLRNYRLKRASQFLQQGYSSSDAAYKTGFTSPAYFTKCFREIYHLTPGEFVKQSAIKN